jgi:hypothetical protein
MGLVRAQSQKYPRVSYHGTILVPGSIHSKVFLDALLARAYWGSQGSRPAADSRTQGYFRGPSPHDVALKGVMQALVRIQAYVLADTVVAIPAVDLAIEAVV